MDRPRISASLKQVELLSAAGVFLLGAGIGAWFSQTFAPYAIVLLALGGLIHLFGMYGKHRLETRDSASPPWWYRVIYWLCWLLLALLGAWLWFIR